MNRYVKSAIAIGAGIVAFNMAKRNNMLSGRKMKKMQKKMTRALF